MPVHREEGRFTIRVELSAEFDESYEGDDDGYAWLTRFREQVQPRLAKAVFDVLRGGDGLPGGLSLRAIPVTRGTSPDENLEIDVRLEVHGNRRPS
jgi:hypothetical protein